jgi:hypothetical protein
MNWRSDVKNRMHDKPVTHDLELFDQLDLYRLADGLLLNDRAAIAGCVDFVLAETKGTWHGRARAMMCRRLKHCEIPEEQRKQLVACIIGRLTFGNFSEQFYDQLRFAIHADRQTVFEAARENLSSFPKDRVKRYSAWVLQHHTLPSH